MINSIKTEKMEDGSVKLAVSTTQGTVWLQFEPGQFEYSEKIGPSARMAIYALAEMFIKSKIEND